jgi:hypothetical protein
VGQLRAVPDDAFNTLRSQLGPGTPNGLRALNDSELQHLVAALTDARRRQAKALADAGDRALGQIPRLLRGPVRRIVG